MNFAHLLLSEVSRLRYRPRTLLGLLSILLLSLVGPATWMRNSSPLTPEDYERAAAQYELAKANCADCTLETFLPEYWGFAELVRIGIAPWMLILSVLVLLLVMVYVGSDFSSGVITTQLTFTPERMSLLAGRVLICGLLGAILMGVAVVASTVLSVVWFVALNGYASLPIDSGLLGVIAMSLLLGLIVGILGALLVFLFNGASVAVAVVAGVLVASTMVEALIYEDSVAPHWAFHVIPTRHAESLVVGMAQRNYDQYPLRSTELLTQGESLLYFLGLLTLAGVLSAVTFSRRDIKN